MKNKKIYNYIRAAIVSADRGDCGCSICQSNHEILSADIDPHTIEIARLAAAPIRERREQEAARVARRSIGVGKEYRWNLGCIIDLNLKY
jgi:hypothetical protein